VLSAHQGGVEVTEAALRFNESIALDDIIDLLKTHEYSAASATRRFVKSPSSRPLLAMMLQPSFERSTIL
jgi:hypothetical protein